MSGNLHLHEVLRVVKFKDIEKRMVVAGGGERLVCNRKMKMFWRQMVVTVVQHHECTQSHRTVPLKMVKMINFM